GGADRARRRDPMTLPPSTALHRPPPPVLREVPVGDSAVPRMELREWAERHGVVAGITTRGRGFSLGLWSEENVGQVMTRWRGVELVKREAFVRASDIVMHCGPGICGSCYEVGSEVLAQLSGRAETEPGGVDLRHVLVEQGRALGLGDISTSPWCSAHDREHF